jgi:hypothetical protein
MVILAGDGYGYKWLQMCRLLTVCCGDVVLAVVVLLPLLAMMIKRFFRGVGLYQG